MTRDQALLEVRDLVVKHGSITAVDGISFSIARGEIFGLLGPNGAGKTTTLNAIEGLLSPSAGTVELDGHDVQRDPLYAKARMGVQLQASSFQPELSIEQLLRLYSGLYGVRATAEGIADQLRHAGLGGELGKPFSKMSGGQQQRFALLIAVIHNPDLVLLDEPTSGLDPQSRRQLWGRVENLRQAGSSVLLTTHSMEEAQAVCDRVAIIDRGKILADEAPAALVAAYRDDPRVTALARGEVTLEDVFIGLTGSDVRD
jgi:ABC-2 type transport system ATP-binding protein